MTIASQADVLGNVAKYLDMAFDRGPVEIPRLDNRNVVIVSKSDYEEMEKAYRNAAYLAKIDRAIEQRKNGTMQEHDLIEDLP